MVQEIKKNKQTFVLHVVMTEQDSIPNIYGLPEYLQT